MFLTASTEALQTEHGHNVIGGIWRREAERRMGLAASSESLEGHLAREGERFLVRRPDGGIGVTAGYHWFGSWGRDTLIALPGLTFYAGRPEEGTDVLLGLGSAVRDGLIPNVFSADGNHAYNSADASLWYVWAVQQMLKALPDRKRLVRERCWPVIKNIIEHYGGGPVGLETLAATINEEAITLEDVYEPYLMQMGFLTRTPRGRCVTRRAYEHLGLTVPGGACGLEQLSL